MKKSLNYLILALFGVVFFMCEERREPALFDLLPSSHTQIDFSNQLDFNENFNIFTYRNFYNGGGVALGDINKDGLIDIYFTANMKSNRLYLNKGDFRFEDITEKAGVSGGQAWSTGVSMADVNGDGWLDIYVCNSGDVEGDNKRNELFINNGDLTFSEKAVEFGVADEGYTTHAAFFDYDRDGDLDLYILNNSYQPVGSFNLRKDERPKRDPLGGDKLLRNDSGKFADISGQAGIYGSVIGFGLGVTIGDVNKDGWPDIYVSNDFFERDYLYINNQNGTFEEKLTEAIKSISSSSMGADLADINNDTWPDFFVTEMLPGSNDRLKSVTTFQNWDTYSYNVANGYHHQFTRNSLQLNNADLTFSEIGRLAGVEATDWSWGALMFDMNNDGLKDIFVANGIYKDLTDQDYLQYVSNGRIAKSILETRAVDYKTLIDAMPSQPVPNVAFENKGGFQFMSRAEEWGLATPSFSNGAAYGDLDNDGDLDLVVNNVNMQAFVYRNQTEIFYPHNRYLKFELTGTTKNTGAFGARITIEAGDKKFYLEQLPTRGYQSSVDHRLNAGLGHVDTVSRVCVWWPQGKVTVLKNVVTNQTLHLNESDAVPAGAAETFEHKPGESWFDKITTTGIDYLHRENDFVDFDRDHLIFHMLSSEGPSICKGDVNGDGLEDFFIGGAHGYPGALFVQSSNNTFRRTNETLLDNDKLPEDTGCTFFDPDNDGDLDLYVASGGSEFEPASMALHDRLYINDGNGTFWKDSRALPPCTIGNTSCVEAADYDKDGDVDLFIGMRMKPMAYGKPVDAHILENNGAGLFADVTDRVAPALKDVGMVKDAVWADIDNDGDNDLMIVGEWMPVRVLVNENGKFVDMTKAAGLLKSNGWWNKIEMGDWDNDGDADFVVGNHGLNSRFQGVADKPVCIYTNDFDRNGDIEQIVCVYNGDRSYPIVLRHDLVTQLQGLKKKYLRYEAYKDQTIEDIFTKDELKGTVKQEASQFHTSLLVNQGRGVFTLRYLPVEAQFSTIAGLCVDDVNGDGNVDILAGGNFYRVKPEVGRYDASYGVLLLGDGHANFQPVHQNRSGWKINGEVRDIVNLTAGDQSIYLVARNNDSLLVFRRNKKIQSSWPIGKD